MHNPSTPMMQAPIEGTIRNLQPLIGELIIENAGLKALAQQLQTDNARLNQENKDLLSELTARKMEADSESRAEPVGGSFS